MIWGNFVCPESLESLRLVPIDGMATLTPEQAKELVDGKWYFNLHTSANPGGEIRGQILKSE